ncbi:hypothetical protein DYB32_009284, partial [Aphanomyces invadans]
PFFNFVARTQVVCGSGAMSLNMDDLVASYLAQRGYQNGGGAVAAPPGLHEYARHVGLSIDVCVANHVLFHGNNKNDPEAYERAYSMLLTWIGNSLDMYKLELHAVAFPLFIHCYLELVAKGHIDAAKAFFTRHAQDHQRLHKLEIRSVGSILTREHLGLNEYAKQVLHSKFHVQLSLLGFQLLHTFLSDHQMFLLLCILNDRVTISVQTNHPSLTIAQCDTSIPSQPPTSSTSSTLLFETSGTSATQVLCMLNYRVDEISQKVQHTPEANHIAAQITSGDYDMTYMAFQDVDAQLALSSTQLPSALCYTIANSSEHLTNVCFSNNGDLVGGAFDDSSFRVWSQDGAPLGGFAHHKDSTSAILRGHAGPVYGCGFTPDNRFALTSSADATIRLWSLASRTTMVVYRAQYPVWDVAMAPLGYYFVSASMDRTARLWSTDRTQPLRVFAGHLSDVEVGSLLSQWIEALTRDI